MTVADHWYGSSANLISIAGTVVTFLSVFISAWLTYWLTVPRCRLRYALINARPINSAKVENQTSETRSDEAHPSSLAKLFLLSIQLSAHGSRDISSSAFDEGKSLILDCGVPLIAQSIKTGYTPQSVSAPKITVNGTALEVGPGLINRRHVLSYDILAEGTKDTIHLVCRSSLTDVAVRRDRKDKKINLLDTTHPARSSYKFWLPGLVILLPLAISVLLKYLSLIISPITLGIVAGVMVIAVTVVTVVYVRRQGFSN